MASVWATEPSSQPMGLFHGQPCYIPSHTQFNSDVESSTRASGAHAVLRQTPQLQLLLNFSSPCFRKRRFSRSPGCMQLDTGGTWKKMRRSSETGRSTQVSALALLVYMLLNFAFITQISWLITPWRELWSPVTCSQVHLGDVWGGQTTSLSSDVTHPWGSQSFTFPLMWYSCKFWNITRGTLASLTYNIFIYYKISAGKISLEVDFVHNIWS